MQTLRTIRLIICSPGDVAEERDVVQRVADEFNRLTANDQGFHVRTWRWETDSYPSFHPLGPQGHIDELMNIADSDFVVGIFWKRFGTPTREADSGTEHELRRAFAAWRKKHRPQCMVYFKQTEYAPKDDMETVQRDAVVRFREEFPQEGWSRSFKDARDFETQFRTHLHLAFKDLARSAQAAPEATQSAPVVDLPQFSDAMTRAAPVARLKAAALEAPVLVIGGLSGTGKTYLASEFANDAKASALRTAVYWHDTDGGESVDMLLDELQKPLSLKAGSTFSRCKELIAVLQQRRALLVIDNFQAVDQTSYAPLITQALKQSPPAVLLLTIQRQLPILQASGALRHVPLQGFSDSEAKTYLQRRGIAALSKPQLRKLIEATEGLPMALSLFCTLVGQFEQDPGVILGDGIERQESVADWFHRVHRHLDEAAAELLRLLSVLEAPFNIGMAKVIAEIGSSQSASDALRLLTAAYLIQRHTPYRWKVHELVASMSRELLPEELQSRVHGVIAQYFMRGYPARPPNAILDDEEFAWKTRALDHLIKSGQHHQRAESLFLGLVATAKARGAYQFVISMVEALQSQGCRDPWLDYHRAHGLLVLGSPLRCGATAQAAAARPDVQDPNLRLALERLRAEAALASGQADNARSILAAALAAADAGKVRGAALEQAQSVVTLVDIAQKRFDAAIESSQRLLAQAAKAGNERSCAVASARIGMAYVQSGRPKLAVPYLEQAMDRFRSSRDRRGEAWAAILLSESHGLIGSDGEAYQMFSKAAAVYADMGECGSDYRDHLERVIRRGNADPQMDALARKEKERILEQFSLLKWAGEVEEAKA